MGSNTTPKKGTATPSVEVGAPTRKYGKGSGRKNVKPDPIVNKSK